MNHRAPEVERQLRGHNPKDLPALAERPLRRIFLVAASSGEGLLTKGRTAARLWWCELAFMPEGV
jgi:hypothetical protein